jgi:hypothetical protein
MGAVMTRPSHAKRSIALLLCLAIVVIVGCSTTGSHVESWDFACEREVWLDATNINDNEQAHLVGVISVLANRGFRLVTEEESDTPLELKFQLHTRNPFDFRCTIVLLDRGMPIISSESVNPGWENLPSRGGNIRAIVRRATKRFGKELVRAEEGRPSRRCS